MLGFLPGFAYMGTRRRVDRRAAARDAARAGAGRIGGHRRRQTGIYPRESPGGWQSSGGRRSTCSIPTRDRRQLFAPGDRVRFVPTVDAPAVRRSKPDPARPGGPATTARADPDHASFARPADDDAGRRSLGVSGARRAGGRARWTRGRIGWRTPRRQRSGRRRRSRRRWSGPSCVSSTRRLIASPAPTSARRSMARAVPLSAPCACRAGSVLRFGERRSRRARVRRVRRRHRRAAGPRQPRHARAQRPGRHRRPRAAGRATALPLGDAAATRGCADAPSARRSARRCATGGARLRVLPGPQDDYFAGASARRAAAHALHVSPQSDRMGYRLTGRAARAAPASAT